MNKERREYLLNINPEPWAIGPVGYARRNGKMSAYVGRNQQLDAFKEAVKEQVEEMMKLGMEKKMTGKLSVTFFFWREQAAYKTPQARMHRKHEADATNMQKATEDALQGLLYDNDKDNSHVQSYIVDQGPDVTGRIVIVIEEWICFNPNLISDEVWNAIDVHEKLGASPRTDPFYGAPDDDIF